MSAKKPKKPRVHYVAGWIVGKLGIVNGRFLRYSRTWWSGYHAGRGAA